VDNNQLHADAVLSNYYDQNWYLDSGASSHITSQHAILELIDNNYIGQSVSTADGVFHKISGIGSTSVNSGSGSINLKQVLYVPSLTRNLISIGSLTDDGRMVLFTRKQCLILQDDPTQNILAVGDRDFRNRLYKFGPQLQANQLITNRSSMDASSEIHLWHRRYGHLHYARLYHLSQKDKVRGLPSFKMAHEICSDCSVGQQHRERFPKASTHRSTHVLNLIDTDLVGHLKIASLSGSRYFIVFTDNYTRKSWVYFLKQKVEAYQKFREFKTRVEKEIGR
jgi:hypothetical protein